MKIKYLKIRNIASIESGDIDFENGLTDNETGLPAALFLITGDTGSGKSVILDCISMALYGTTPRVKGVNGVKNNTYTNTEGEEISVNDIRQYTRIGIHWKDKCFSELSFTGNDGVEYVATFSLGRTSHRNYRDPVWKLQIGEFFELNNRKEEIREKIQEAVGLSFEQFSRMAMLAQGQFATFLTGKKEERERILEQLTATDIFSRYGEVISDIFRRAKHEKDLSANLYEEFGKKILSEEVRQELISSQKQKQELAYNLRTETEKLRQRISHAEALTKAEKDISDLKKEQSLLKEEEETPELQKKSALIALWDKTENERKLVADKIEACRMVESDTQTLQEIKTEFNILSEDLNIRQEAASICSAALENERKWIESQYPLRNIYDDSAVTILKIQSFQSLFKESDQKDKEVKEGIALIENLQKDLEEQEKSVKEKGNACDKCLEAIRRKTSERDALHPSELRKDKELLLDRKHILQDLSLRLAKTEIEKADTQKAEKDVTDTAVILAELKEKAEKASLEFNKAEKDLKRAEERYMTMHLSVDRNFKDLRRKLADEHAEICPLCGQSIANHLKEWNSEGYFTDLLTPLEEEKNKLAEICSIAKKESEEAVKKFNTTAGSLKVKETELRKKKKSLSKAVTENKEQIKILKLTESDFLTTSISQELEKVSSEIILTSEKLALAENMQKDLDSLFKQKESLDKVYRDAESLLQKSVRKLTMIKETVKNAEKRLMELKQESQILRETLDKILKGYSDDWMSDPMGVASRLRKDADEFAERTSVYNNQLQTQNALLKDLESLTATREKIADILNSLDGESQGALAFDVKSLKLDALLKKWNDIVIEVSTVVNHREENKLRIKEIDIQLDKCFQETGTSETTLRQLLGTVKEVNAARLSLQAYRDKLSKNTALLTEAIKCRDENLKALDIAESSQLVDLDKVKNVLDSNERTVGELTQQLGVIKERLEADSKTRKDTERQRKDLERKTLRYEKWEKMNKYFGGSKFRTLVQSHILRPLLYNANIYLRQITDHYTLTCSDENEQLSILVLDRYNNNEPRSVTVLSGGERFMISLALSLALSAMNRPDLNVDILFIDEGFGTLDAKSLDMVMATLRRLPEINGQTGRRVGVISHREELTEQIPTQIQLRRSGEGRSKIVISTNS